LNLSVGIVPLEELELEGKRVLVRLDLELPVDEPSGAVTDDSKLLAALPTLTYLAGRGARLVVAGHRGHHRPKSPVRLSLEPVGSRLAELTHWEVFLPEAPVGDVARKLVAELRAGQACLLENLVWSAGEESNDEAFIRELLVLADVYVADTLSVLGRPYASVVGLPPLLPRSAGLWLRRELEAFERLDAPDTVAILGGSFKREAPMLEALLARCRAVLVGGQIGWTLLGAQGIHLGQTTVDAAAFAQARTLLDKARQRKVDLVLAKDVVAGPGGGTLALDRMAVTEVPATYSVLDIGPATVALWRARVAQSTAILWNGPLTSKPGTAQADGSLALAEALATGPGYCLVGPDSTLLLGPLGLDPTRFGWVTQGAEAARQLLSGKRLPGLEALRGRV
jgi:phosphoglycerate kinase